MYMPKLTRKFIDKNVHNPLTGQVLYRDSELIGFGLRATRGSKSFIVECKVNGINRRVTIGRYGVLPLEEARKRARIVLLSMLKERDSSCPERKTRNRCATLSEIKINYPGTGNNSQFTYDGLGRCVEIVEQSGGTTTSTKQFVWCGNRRCEARDGTGTLVSQYFLNGQVNYNVGVGTNYFYTRDQLGSIREVYNNSGTVQAQYSYDTNGQVILLQGTNLSDFQYAGYYSHQRSGLNLTRTRVYSAKNGGLLIEIQSERKAERIYSVCPVTCIEHNAAA
jgi:YD repeat-containing protein